jgi:hypothetical protein
MPWVKLGAVFLITEFAMQIMHKKEASLWADALVTATFLAYFFEWALHAGIILQVVAFVTGFILMAVILKAVYKDDLSKQVN